MNALTRALANHLDYFLNKKSKKNQEERAGRQDEAQEAYADYLKVAPLKAKARIEQARRVS
jgi:hypothetical protein